jgi:hypothetical protein
VLLTHVAVPFEPVSVRRPLDSAMQPIGPAIEVAHVRAL